MSRTSTAATLKPSTAKGELIEIVPRQPNQAGRPTLAELERRKGKVMEIATELFVNHGYAATSLVDIAKSAGVATRTLYQHFGDKEAIFREVVFARETGAIVSPPKLAVGDTLYTSLSATARYATELALRERSVELMRLMIAEGKRFPDLMKKVATATFSRFQGNVAKIFKQLADQGLIEDGDHAQSAQLFIDLILGNSPAMVYSGWQASPPSDADLEVKVDLFIQGRFGGTIARRARTRAVKSL